MYVLIFIVAYICVRIEMLTITHSNRLWFAQLFTWVLALALILILHFGLLTYRLGDGSL